MDEESLLEPTTFRILPADNGWINPISRRQIRETFGYHFFYNVDLGIRNLVGRLNWPNYYGVCMNVWTGVPITFVSLIRGELSGGVSFTEQPEIGYARPRLCIPQVRPGTFPVDENGQESWGSFVEIFERIRTEVEEWDAIPKEQRIHNRGILFCIDESKLVVTIHGFR